ncbi:MAG: RNA polymerase sigma factor [Casimicrobium sp.]
MFYYERFQQCARRYASATMIGFDTIAATPSPRETDAALVARCVAGDGPAWDVLVRRYQRLVYAIVMRMQFDEHVAADVFQTVFTRLIDHLPRLTEPDRLQAWIVTTAKRESLLYRKRALRNVSLTPESDDEETHDIEDDAWLPDQALENLQMQNIVRNAMVEIDARCRELLSLLYSEDDKTAYDEVAEQLGMPIGSIGPTRARCLEKLRKLVDR